VSPIDIGGLARGSVFGSNVKVRLGKSKVAKKGKIRLVTVIGSFSPSKKYGRVVVLIEDGDIPMSDSGE
jgi:hypothetical protein